MSFKVVFFLSLCIRQGLDYEIEKIQEKDGFKIISFFWNYDSNNKWIRCVNDFFYGLVVVRFCISGLFSSLVFSCLVQVGILFQVCVFLGWFVVWVRFCYGKDCFFKECELVDIERMRGFVIGVGGGRKF